MKLKVPISIICGRDTADMEIEVSVDADQIAAAIADSKGLAPMHIINACHNFRQFLADIDEAQISTLAPAARASVAAFLRETADSFHTEKGD